MASIEIEDYICICSIDKQAKKNIFFCICSDIHNGTNGVKALVDGKFIARARSSERGEPAA